MHEIYQIIKDHPFELASAGAFCWWCFSNFMSQAAPLKEDAGWWATSIHNFAQFVAANPYKYHQVTNPTQPTTIITSSVK